MRGEPLDRTAHLSNDAIEPRCRGQRVFDDREINPQRQQALREEGEILLVPHRRTLALRAAQSATIASRSGTAAELL